MSRRLVTPAATAKRPKQAERLDEFEAWRLVVDSWKRVQRGMEKNIVVADLTLAELRTLWLLGEKGPSPMNRLSHETMLSQPTITGLVDKLEERGLVERVRNNEDRREVLIAITAKGSGVLAKGVELHKQFVRHIFSTLGNDEMAQLGALLKQVADMSEALPPGADSV